jgi:glycosyltransferase involved in cell wall biosynthesis
MRVAFVSVSDQMGGSEVVLLQILRGLRLVRPAWELQLVAPGPGPLSAAARATGTGITTLAIPGALSTFGETAAVNGRTSGSFRFVRAAAAVPGYQRAMNAVLSRLTPDVVHTNGFKAHVFAARGRAAGAALIWHLHEYISRRPLTRTLLRRYARRCDAIVANSESVAADASRALDGREVRVILNAVDLEVFSPRGAAADLDARCGLPPAPAGTVRVGLVATFARWKGHAAFLEAIASLPRDIPIRAYIVGGPMYDTRGSQYSAEELRSRVRALQLEDRVGFTGLVAEPADVLRALDIVVHASTDPEPFGMVIAEAMACGRAVVTSASGGAGELVRDGVDALVHAPGNAAGLAACIRRLAADPALREGLGRQARAVALERFDSARLTAQFASVYEQAAAGRQRRT